MAVIFVVCGAVVAAYFIFRACQRRQRHEALIQQYNQEVATRNQHYQPPPQPYIPLVYNPVVQNPQQYRP